jgi:hypothetical protein
MESTRVSQQMDRVKEKHGQELDCGSHREKYVSKLTRLRIG